MATNPELEERIRENPGDTQAYLVYADFLQSHGDPRGELIVLQNEGKTKEAEDFIEAHTDELLGPLARYAKHALDGVDKPVFEWHLGFIRSARLSYEQWLKEELFEPQELESIDLDAVSLEEALSELLQHASGKFLQHLLVPMNMLDDGCYFEPICKSLARFGAPSLVSLRMGEYLYAGPRGPQTTDYNYEISWTTFGDMTGMWTALPRLERLELQGFVGDEGYPGPSTLGEIDLPRLKHLEIRTGGMSARNTASVAQANWPALEYMDLWFGDETYGFSGGVDDLEPFLDGTRLPHLTHLGLMNAPFTDELCARLPGAKILPRLKELSLALGTMTETGAQALLDNAEAFAHLDVLDLEHNYLPSEAAQRLESLCGDVRVGEQRSEEDYAGVYPAVGE